MTDDLQAVIERVRSGRLWSDELLQFARLLCKAIESVPVYRISEDKNSPTYSGHLHDAEFLELLVGQCNVALYELVAIAKLAVGESTDILGTNDGVAFRVERIR